jgi:hypothetical protein
VNRSPEVKRSKRGQKKQHRRPGKNGAVGRNAKSPSAGFNELVGRGAQLWDDQEFERFQAWLRESRRTNE